MGIEVDDQLIGEAQNELARYLSDEIAPMIFAGSAEVLLNSPPEIMARSIHGWVGIQLQGAAPSTIADYLLHAARKVHHLGELELIPREDLKVFLDRLRPMLLSICPEGDRSNLAVSLAHLDVVLSDNPAVAARISVDRVPAMRGGDPGGATGGGDHAASGAYPPAAGGGGSGRSATAPPAPAQRLERPPDAPERSTPPPTQAAGQSAAMAEQEQTAAHLNRLNMLLDRWERVAAAPPVAQSTPSQLNATLAAAQGALLSRIIDEVATSARSTADLDNQLRYLNQYGVGSTGSGVFRVLSNALPDWAPAQAPAPGDTGGAGLSGAAQTMRKVVELAKGPAELNDRFKELISTAIDEFNGGSLGRAVTVIDLAQRMVAQKEVDPSFARTFIEQAGGRIDEAQLRGFAENDDKRLLLRRVLDFFPRLQIDNLIQDLFEEKRRDRRRLILRLLMIHGEAARGRAIKILDDSLSGNVAHPWYAQRNLIYLMRSIDPSDELDIEKEIDLLIRASVPGGELPLIREALTGLGQIDHPRASKTLVARVSDLEDVLLQKGNAAHKPEEIQSLLDTALKAMMRFDSKETRQCIVNHGLSRRSEFGPTLARLAMLGASDLSDDPVTVNRIIDAIKAELPVKVFGVSVKSARKAQNLQHLFESLSGTDTPKVRKVYDSIVRNFPGERFANAAAKCLSQLGARPATDRSADDEQTLTSLSGDLALFGLPNLMQNLADSRLEGVLTVLDDTGSAVANIALRDGLMVDASYGDLAGETAVYQLLERPVIGRFIFVTRQLDRRPDGSPAGGNSVMSLLMEGMRRYDEFNRAAAVVADDARFGATGSQPTSLPDEGDAAFVNGIWVQATRGTSPLEIERTAKVDGYRVFRLFEHWLGEGALEPRS
ncbi:MAG: DUF4388 domain-containing protein [Thermoanaerobaculales bacterium]|nr:DUF4388 domain-containing protein [Thermoanaerobaculales bacterium]